MFKGNDSKIHFCPSEVNREHPQTRPQPVHIPGSGDALQPDVECFDGRQPHRAPRSRGSPRCSDTAAPRPAVERHRAGGAPHLRQCQSSTLVS
ncbi:hypothetical protein CEXT_435211 [Caerostris extrusa]|uniref:Uncharacterized protein n=1 Tax=Caerostris extrusa TaxID=172846 RepID=A0AAV4SKP9_CAEEX|nr:hypothetical protein CEXT_435211 [Caerostris extrusa]